MARMWKGEGDGRKSGHGSQEEPGCGRGPDPEAERAAPDKPTDMGKRSWRAVFRRTVAEFKDDELSDRAAGLTYYAILAVFPALLVVVSIVGAVGPSATDSVLDDLAHLAPGAARDVLTNAVRHLQAGQGTGSALAVVGLVLALWSASGYVAAFIRTSNAVYDIAEGRPVWKITPLRLALTLVLLVLAGAGAVIVAFTGGLARAAGNVLGIGDTGVTVWAYAKWPVLVLLVTFMIAVLYWAAPNARGRGFRWVTPGSALALLIWLVASAAFAAYVANFASYNKTYGSIGGVIIFLVWLWITNLAILLGLEFDAELSRQRAILAGHPRHEEPYVPPRDTRAWADDGDD